MATNPNYPSREELESDPDSDSFDPNRFGRHRMSTGFLKWVLSTPMPRSRDEDLWKDTLPPGAVKPAEPAPGEPSVEVKDDTRVTEPKGFRLSPAEAEALKGGNKFSTAKIVALTVVIAALFGGVIALFVVDSAAEKPGATVIDFVPIEEPLQVKNSDTRPEPEPEVEPTAPVVKVDEPEAPETPPRKPKTSTKPIIAPEPKPPVAAKPSRPAEEAPPTDSTPKKPNLTVTQEEEPNFFPARQ